MRALPTAAVVILAAGVAGCGATSKTTASSTTRVTSTTVSVARAGMWGSPAEIAANKALAKRGLLTLTDLPTGWTEEPDKSGSAPASVLNHVAACMHLDAAHLAHSPSRVDSPDFKDSSGATASNSVTVAPNAAITTQYLTDFEAPAAPGCLRTTLQSYLRDVLRKSSEASTVTLGETAVARMSFPGTGDQTVAYRITVPLTADATSVTLYIDAILIRVGRAESGLILYAQDAPPGAQREERLATLTAHRLKAIMD